VRAPDRHRGDRGHDVSADALHGGQREGREPARRERTLQRRGASEFIGMVFHGYTITHVDTPAHFFWQGKIYNDGL